MSGATHVVGVACVLFDSYGNVLLQQRTKDPGRGLLVVPGGRMDIVNPVMEMKRELTEELGIVINAFHLTSFHFSSFDSEGEFPAGIMLYYWARTPRSTPRNMEPDKCAGLTWIAPTALPLNMWESDRKAVQIAFKLQTMAFDHE